MRPRLSRAAIELSRRHKSPRAATKSTGLTTRASVARRGTGLIKTGVIGLQNRRFQVRVLGAPLRFSQGWIARSLQGATIRAGIRRQNSSPSRSPRSANRLVRGVLTIANRSHGSAERGPSAAPRRGRSPRCRGARAAQPVLAFCSTARAGAGRGVVPKPPAPPVLGAGSATLAVAPCFRRPTISEWRPVDLANAPRNAALCV